MLANGRSSRYDTKVREHSRSRSSEHRTVRKDSRCDRTRSTSPKRSKSKSKHRSSSRERKKDKKGKKSKKKKRSSSSSSSDSDEEELKLLQRLEAERLRLKEEKRKQKELIKANETPEEKRFVVFSIYLVFLDIVGNGTHVDNALYILLNICFSL